MSSGLQPVTTYSFPSESFSFKPLRIVHTLFLWLDSLFVLPTGQASMYRPWPSLWYGFYSQNTLLEGFMYSRHLSGKKIQPPRPRQGLSPAALTGSSGLRACRQFACTVHSCRAPQILETSPVRSQSSGRVLFTEKPVMHESIYCLKSFRRKTELEPFLPWSSTLETIIKMQANILFQYVHWL